jgi:general secretion pathway protein I
MISDSKGFSLLEVVVALAIMAGGFLSVLQLYSMSIRSVGVSEKYLKGTMLAQTKMAELELDDYDLDKDEGVFDFEEGYQWKVKISPYDSPLNSEEENIQLSKVMVRVFWFEEKRVRSVNLNTIKLNGSTYPMVDSQLEKIFSRGVSAVQSNDKDYTKEDNSNPSPFSPAKIPPCIGIGGVQTPCPIPNPKEKPPCPLGLSYFFGVGCR